jgi:hypothetical protein
MYYELLKEDGYALLKEDGYAILLEYVSRKVKKIIFAARNMFLSNDERLEYADHERMRLLDADRPDYGIHSRPGGGPTR